MTNTLAELRDALEPLFDSIPLMPVTLSGEQVLRIVVASRCLEAGSVPDEPPSNRADALADLAYRDGAQQALAMAHQSLAAADAWLAGGCGNRVTPARAVLNRQAEQELPPYICVRHGAFKEPPCPMCAANL